MKTNRIGKSISVLSRFSSSAVEVLRALEMPVMILFRIDHRVYNPPTTIAPTPAYLICVAQIPLNCSTLESPGPHPFINPYIGTKTMKPSIPPKKINDAILMPTINPTDNNATERSIPP